MKNFLLPVILFCASLCCTALEIDPAKAVIVAPGSEKLAAGELQKHLKLITGVEIPIQGKADGQFAFTLGNSPSDAGLQPVTIFLKNSSRSAGSNPATAEFPIQR